MWNSHKKVTVSKTSYESLSATDNKRISHHLRRSPKAKMTELRDIFQKDNIIERCKKNDVRENGHAIFQDNKLRRHVKEKLKKENVTEDCISKEAIPLPWAPEDPNLPSEDDAIKSPVSENSNKRVVVELKWLENEGNASIKGSGEQAACGFKASLTLAEADKVNEFIAQLRKEKASNDEALIGNSPAFNQVKTPTMGKTTQNAQQDLALSTDDSACSITRTKANNNQQNMTNALATEANASRTSAQNVTQKHELPKLDLTSANDFSTMTKYSTPNRNISPTDTTDISSPSLYEITSPKLNRRNKRNPITDTYKRSPYIPTIDTDPIYNTKAKADRDTTELDRMVQSALAIARARKEVSLQKIIDDADNIPVRGRRFRSRDTMSMARGIDSDSYRSRDAMSMARTTEFDRYFSRNTDYTQRSRSSCEPSDSLAMTSLQQQDESAPLRTDDVPLKRISMRATSMPAESRSLKALKLTEKNIKSGTVPPLQEEDSKDEMEIKSDITVENKSDIIMENKSDITLENKSDNIPSNNDDTGRADTPFTDKEPTGREGSPLNEKPSSLPDITEIQEAFGSIMEEMDLLTTYHGAGVFSLLTTDGIPDIQEPRIQINDQRRGRSVSVMRRLLSDGEGQYSRESTPMASLRRQFKVKMKIASLHEAASVGDLRDVTYLLEENEVDVNSTDQMERTALHMAAEKGYTDIAEILVDKGCNVNAADAGGRTPLHYAVESGEEALVSLLLAAGAQVDVMENSRGRTPIHLATVANSLQILKVLLEPLIDDPWEGRRIVKIADKDGRTLLHMTAHHGLQDATSLLLTAGAEVNARDFSGNTPMHAVILTRLRRKDRICSKVLEVLLDSGGDVEGGGGGDEGGDAGTLLHAAASVGCLDCLRVLVKRSAQLEAKDFFGKTPLQIAIEEDHVDAVSFLLENNASMEETDSRGQRPLHHAIMADSPKLVEALLIAGADRNARDRDDKTYFQFALVKRRYQALDALIKHRVTDVGEDQHAIHFCASIGNQAALDVLLNNAFNINEIDVKGRTALHHAISSGHESLVLYLLANGASARRADDNGATPLHYAVRWGGSDALLRRLVKKQGNVNAVDRLGRTPLHYAASKSSIMSDMYILVNSGAQINTKDNRGLTPLHLAARLGNESLVRILLDNDARHDIPDCDEFLPIDHARENGHKCIIKRLEAYHIKKEREKEKRLTSFIPKKEELEEMEREGEEENEA